MPRWILVRHRGFFILRTEIVGAFDFEPVAKRSIIYSHVAGYLEAFAGKPVDFFNYPLVWYKNDEVPGHWERVARKFNVFDEYFWTLGFINHLDHLVAVGALDRDRFRFCFETTPSGRLRFISTLIEKLSIQVRKGRNSRLKRQKLTSAEFERFYNFIESNDPRLGEILFQIRHVYESSQSGRLRPVAWFKELVLLAKIRMSINKLFKNQTQFFFLQRYQNYLIYRMAQNFYAIREDFNASIEMIINQFDSTDISPVFFRSSSLEQTFSKIQNAKAESAESCRELLNARMPSGGSYREVPPLSFIRRQFNHGKTLLKLAFKG